MIIPTEPSIISYKFTKKVTNSPSPMIMETPGKVSIEVNDDLDMDDLLDMFENFLRACGFPLESNEKLSVVNFEEERDDEGFSSE